MSSELHDIAQDPVEQGARVYFVALRGRVRPFVDEQFSIAGTLKLHRAAFGWDILRSPVNLLLALPQVLMHLVSRMLAKPAPGVARMLKRPIILQTAVGRELEWSIHTKLLQVPFSQTGRESTRDVLTETILSNEIVVDRLKAGLPTMRYHGDDADFRARLLEAMKEYGISRAAASEIATGLTSLGGGALVLHKLTPGAISLGPALAGSLAQQAAIGAFPLGGGLGGLWYGFFPASPGAGLIAAATGGLMLASTLLAAFAGVISDPIQRATGLHERRFIRMVDGLERQFFDPALRGFAVRDHYVARLLDLFDILGAAIRLAR